MSLPELLSGAVGGDDVVTRVPLGGDDILAVTQTRTLVYRADGLLSDETVEEYAHDAERLAVSTGRRKSEIVFDYGLDGGETLSVPAKRLDDVVYPVLTGVLSARGVTDPGESVVRTFRFSELTLVVTEARLVKHVGTAVWDGEFEAFSYADVTDLGFEEGTVATTVVLTHDGRSERFKAPNESARAVRESLVEAVCEFHDVRDLEELRAAVAVDEEESDAEASGRATDFGEGPDPLSASPAADHAAGTAAETPSVPAGGSDDRADGSTPGSDGVVGERRAAASGETASEPPADEEAAGSDGFEESSFENARIEREDALAAEVAELRRTVEEQSARLDAQSDLLERLIEELRQGR